jgi:hypothetical protein
MSEDEEEPGARTEIVVLSKQEEGVEGIDQ